jgi:hypothetical protein
MGNVSCMRLHGPASGVGSGSGKGVVLNLATGPDTLCGLQSCSSSGAGSGAGAGAGAGQGFVGGCWDDCGSGVDLERDRWPELELAKTLIPSPMGSEARAKQLMTKFVPETPGLGDPFAGTFAGPQMKIFPPPPGQSSTLPVLPGTLHGASCICRM